MRINSLHPRKVLVAILFVALMNVAERMNAQSFTVDNLRYLVISETTVELISFVDGTATTGPLSIPETVTYDGTTYTVTKIESCAFFNCSGFTGSLIIPNSVESIGEGAFYGCSGFTGSLIIPNTVTEINNMTFYGCSGFTGSLTIPNSVESIKWSAFEGCSSLSDTLTLGAALTEIENNAFFGACSNFTALIVRAEVPPTLGPNALTSVNYDIPISIPCGTCNTYQNAPGWDAFTNINILNPDQGFEIVAMVNPNESGIVKGSCIFPQGHTCTLTAAPNEGYVFENWTENGEVVSTEAIYSFMVNGDRTLTANFVADVFHPYVDLGLPSGLLWATCNIGADSPEGYGDILPWGEPDVATANWGGSWRVPTLEEMQELCDNTTFTWTNRNGVNGGLFTASNGNSIFFPAAGMSTNGTIYSAGIAGYSWSSDAIWLLAFTSGEYGLYDLGPDYYWYEFGTSVRPVRTSAQIPTHDINVTANHSEYGEISGGGSYQESTECTLTAIPNEGCGFAYWKENDEIVSWDSIYSFLVGEDRNLMACFYNPDVHEYVDLGLPSGTLWATCNVGTFFPEDYIRGTDHSWGSCQSYHYWDLYPYSYSFPSGYKLIKYCNNPDYGVNGFTDNLTTLLPEDDMATINWGLDWRTPTAEEWEELIQNTTYTWVVHGQVVGALLTASNGNSIFLLVTDILQESIFSWINYDESGSFYYWTSSLDTINPLKAYNFYGEASSSEISSVDRSSGISIRPVRSSWQNNSYTITTSTHSEEGGTVTGAGVYTIGDTCTLTATPNENWVFTSWKENGVTVSTDSAYSFMVTRNRNLVAHFVNPNVRSFVDLGLPSGALWADRNVGANLPEDYGDYFAWGELQPKSEYRWNTYMHCMMDWSSPRYQWVITKYNNPDMTLEPNDDAANANCGSDSRIPFKEEWQELIDNCSSEWTTQNGMEGMLFTGPNGNSIFLPGVGTNLIPYGNGYYWSSSLSQNSEFAACDFSITPEGCSLTSLYRCCGSAVRPVYYEFSTYVINANANLVEGGTVTGGDTFRYGQTCALTASVNEGYIFLNWTRDGTVVSTDTTYSFVVTEDVDLVANFAEEGSACYLNFDLRESYGYGWEGAQLVITDENGFQQQLTRDYNGYFTLPFLTGSHLTLTWIEGIYSYGYSFTISYENGVVIYESSGLGPDFHYEFDVDCSMVYTDYTITATADPSEYGTVTGDGTFEYRQTCTLTASAHEGYRFAYWSENGLSVSTDTIYSFSVSSDRDLVAHFVDPNSNICSYVDLGLPSGLLWATSNVGAYYQEDYGDYFAWGETQPKSSYSYENYIYYCPGPQWYIPWFSKYCYDPNYGCNGFVDDLSVLEPEDDAATANWDSNSHTPTKEEWQELMDNCSSVWTTQNGVYGMRFIGPNGNSIFLPKIPKGYSNYWSSSLSFLYFPSYAWTFTIAPNGCYLDGSDYGRPQGYPVRAVSTSAQYLSNAITATVDPIEGGWVYGEGAFLAGAECTLTATANEGSVFVCWTKNGEVISTDPTYSFTVTEAANYVANFGLSTVTQTNDLVTGWNWYSTYIELSDIDGLAMLEEQLGNNAEMINSQVAYTTYYEGYGWWGSLEAINNESMYRLKLLNPTTITMTGLQADPLSHPISITKGWNHIAYISSMPMEVGTALAGLASSQGDMVKSQSKYATYYDGYGWYGSLTTSGLINPGDGLMYKSEAEESKTFTYPANPTRGVHMPVESEAKHWTNDAYAYPNNMTMLAVVELDGVELTTDNYELATFADDGCRGSIRLMYVEPMDRYVAFLTVAGDEAQELHFALYNTLTGETILNANERVTYLADDMMGTIDEPFVLHFRQTTGVDEAEFNALVYPNPTDGSVTVEAPAMTHLTVTNVLGQVLYNADVDGNRMQLDFESYQAGVYLIQIHTTNGNIVKKITLTK